MHSVMVEDQLKAVQQLIAIREYDLARQLLYRIEHPLAHDWLQKLNHPPFNASRISAEKRIQTAATLESIGELQLARLVLANTGGMQGQEALRAFDQRAFVRASGDPFFGVPEMSAAHQTTSGGLDIPSSLRPTQAKRGGAGLVLIVLLLGLMVVIVLVVAVSGSSNPDETAYNAAITLICDELVNSGLYSQNPGISQSEIRNQCQFSVGLTFRLFYSDVVACYRENETDGTELLYCISERTGSDPYEGF